MDGDMEAKWRGTDAHLTLADPSSSEQFHVVMVSDTGRNWSDQEVRALIQVWSEERVCRQLESSTRKRDIFVQISNRLMQQGIERDWKQCHTKYKNLKYLYRSLQRGKGDEADPRRLMRFYDEVDAIMNRTTNGSPYHTGTADKHADSGRLTMPEGREDDDRDQTNAASGPTEDRTCSSDSVSSTNLNVTTNNGEPRLHPVQELHSDQQHRLMSSSEPEVKREELHSAIRRAKRKAADQDLSLQTPVKRLDSGSDAVEARWKEEPDHIPIMKINSVCSIAPSSPSPETEVTPPDTRLTQLEFI
ncbi:uncharacterized protein PEZ65_004849 [Lycodopsis pacificus]